MLKTERLTLRPWNMTDLEYYLKLARDVGYNCFSTPGQFPLEPSQAGEWLAKKARLFEERRAGSFLILRHETGEAVGTCGLSPYLLEGAEVMELGYRLALAHWNSGYATEAARAQLRYGFEALGLQRVVAFAVPQNRASLRVMEKLGFRYAKDFQHAGLNHALHYLNREDFL